jgi:nucleotide-binding universal stress UspA family protein
MLKILVALDGSESDQVMQMVQHLKLQPETTVVLTHVITNLDADPEIAADRPQADREPIPHHHLEKLQTYQASLPCKSELELVTGSPAEEIVRLSHIHQVELIVMGSRGLTGVKRILQGSVSSQVVEEAACSVLVVKVK